MCVAHLPYFAEMDTDEVFAVSAEHILAGVSGMLEEAKRA